MNQLRTFSNLGNTGPIIPTLLNGGGQTANFNCALCNIDGYAAASGWLQFHDLASTASLSSGVTVPMRSYYVSAAGPLPSISESAGGPITFFNGLCIAFSSTEGVYTAVGTSYDVFGEIDEYEIPITSLMGTITSAGDRTTTVGALLVWADDGGGVKEGLHTLLEVVASTDKATPDSFGWSAYLLLFAHSPTAGDVPIMSFPFSANQTRILRMNMIPFEQSPIGTFKNGCYLYGSSTGGKYTAISGNHWKLQARYLV